MYAVRLGKQAVGLTLGQNIYDKFGRILLRRGVKLTSSYVSRLRKKGFRNVYVLNELAPDLDIQKAVSQETHNLASRAMRDFSKRALRGDSVRTKWVDHAIEKIVDELGQQKDAILNLTSIKTMDNYTYEHSVNVCVASLMISQELAESTEDPTELGQGAIMHDVGKLSVPPDILLKPDELTDEEYDIIKRHSTAGYNILSEILNDTRVPEVALNHHERLDGTGYPQGRSADDLDTLSRIVAVADIYDALTSDRIYRKKMHPHEAIELIEKQAGTKLDEEIVEIVSKKVAHYEIGTIIELNTEELAVVIEQDEKDARRPIIRKVVASDGMIIDSPQEIKLSEHPDLCIDEVHDSYPKYVRKQF